MSILPNPKDGEILTIKDYQVPFSFWPTRKTNVRCVLNTRIFANNPWLMITNSIKDKIKVETRRHEALAYCEQSQDFFRSAQTARVSAAKPILLYYAFMNLAKAFILLKNVRPGLSKAFHGLVTADVSKDKLASAKIQVHKNRASSVKTNVFDDFYNALCDKNVTVNKFEYNLRDLVPQVIVGHRLWLEAINSSSSMRYKERFVSVDKLHFMHNKDTKELWLRIYLKKSALTRFGYNLSEFIEKADRGNWTAVKAEEGDYRCYEQKVTVKHRGSPADYLANVTEGVRTTFWQTVRSDEPYRRYYLYANPSQNSDQVLPQILSVYAIMFYLGSITRYRPLRYDKIADSKFGAFIESFIDSQPTQFLYLMASRFDEREIAKAAIV